MKKNQSEANLRKLIFYSNFISYTLTFIVLILYFSFIVVLGFMPEFFHKFIGNTSITYGIFSGLAIITISIFLTFIYVILSNLLLDNIEIKDE
tara:strand:+ start:462 stop:740 length:279 start_codon:yes stop_codon:yes gene_type:complete